MEKLVAVSVDPENNLILNVSRLSTKTIAPFYPARIHDSFPSVTVHDRLLGEIKKKDIARKAGLWIKYYYDPRTDNPGVGGPIPPGVPVVYKGLISDFSLLVLFFCSTLLKLP